jgi:hypothetical protein
MKNSLLILVALFIWISSDCQQPVRRLPNIINHPSLNLSAPFISADGNALLFISDSGQDGEYAISYTSRELDWNPPVELPKHLNNRLNFTRGYALSADGKRIYITSAKSPVIGGYDIFTAELKGNAWTNPENLMLPINSKTNDGCPSFTPDGNIIYFMRCEKMTTIKADGCKIFRSAKKPNGQWEEPQELPEFINTGNSQTPRIMADKETLIFSSDKMPGNKGGMDLYLTRFQQGKWSEPVPLDFVNSERDDQYISVNALGRYLIKEAKGARNNWELTEFLIPSNLRPKGLMKVEGKVVGEEGGAVAAYISLLDVLNGKRIHSMRPAADGSFFFYLSEGSRYVISFDPENSDVGYMMKEVDLTGDKISQKEKVNATLKKVQHDEEFTLATVTFQPYASSLSPESQEELKRLARIIKSHPDLGFEIQVMLTGYRESWINSDPALTEIMEVEEPSVSQDSTLVADDSVVQMRRMYHNDRTAKQAQAIIDYLTNAGVNREQLSLFVNAIPGSETDEVLVIKTRIHKLKR